MVADRVEDALGVSTPIASGILSANEGVEAWNNCFGQYPTLIRARIRLTPSASPAEPWAITSGFFAATAAAVASKLTVSGGYTLL